MPHKDPEARRAYQRAYKADPENRKARRERDRAAYASDPDFRSKQLAASYAWSKSNREKANELQRAYTRRTKRTVIDHYGGRCACCGEAELAFLAIDHIDGNGYRLRKSGTHPRQGGVMMYAWLRRNDYPDGFQVLCHNCNIGKKINGGVCPHQDAGSAPESVSIP